MEFSHELALAMVQSKDPFPADFDQAWRWIGYSTKQKAKNKLINNLEAEVDYTLNHLGKRVEGNRGGGSVQFESIHLTIDCLKSLGMMAGTLKGKEIRRYFLECERIAKQSVLAHTAQSQELELKKLELQLIQAKQRYQGTGCAIQLSTSAAVLTWLRGETPPPPKVEYLERFIDARTGQEVGSSSGRSLTQLITDAGLNPKSARDRNRVKRVLKRYGMDYDKMEQWGTASYLRKYPVLEDEVYDRALKAVLGEVAGESEQNLFVHQMQQASLAHQAGDGSVLIGE